MRSLFEPHLRGSTVACSSVCILMCLCAFSFHYCNNYYKFHCLRCEQQLVELSDRIGYVSTGLKDDEISRCVGKVKVPIPNDLPSKPTIMDKKCSVCQVGPWHFVFSLSDYASISMWLDLFWIMLLHVIWIMLSFKIICMYVYTGGIWSRWWIGKAGLWS